MFFGSDKQLESGAGCHYFPFNNDAFWDAEKRILCFGKPDANGRGVEFTPHIVALISEGRLNAVFMDLSDLEAKMPF